MPTAGSSPYGIAAGPDGNLWFPAGTQVAKVTTAGVLTLYNVMYTVGYVAAGFDGTIWFTTEGDFVGRLTTSGTNITVFEGPIANTDIFSVTAGPDGYIWGTEGTGFGGVVSSRVVRITP